MNFVLSVYFSTNLHLNFFGLLWYIQAPRVPYWSILFLVKRNQTQPLRFPWPLKRPLFPGEQPPTQQQNDEKRLSLTNLGDRNQQTHRRGGTNEVTTNFSRTRTIELTHSHRMHGRKWRKFVKYWPGRIIPVPNHGGTLGILGFRKSFRCVLKEVYETFSGKILAQSVHLTLLPLWIFEFTKKQLRKFIASGNRFSPRANQPV